MLTARLLLEQGVEVTGLVFISNFFGAKKARRAAEQLGIKLKEIDIKKEHLAVVKSPKYGYGKNMNPCIDCHALMLRHAKAIMEGRAPSPCEGEGWGEVYDFVATGEVLGQRPMSQGRKSLDIVNKESGLNDLLVRPMSAKLLPESRPEKAGKIIRGKLLDIKGRSREKQKELVVKFGIKEYATPGGGCLLTDREFSQRLIKMFDYWSRCSGDDVELLKNGRVFWLKTQMATNNVLMVVGRDEKDCDNLEKLAKNGDVVVKLKEIVGPTTLIRIKNYELRIKNYEIEVDIPIVLKMSELRLDEEKSIDEVINIAALLTGYYATKARGTKSIVQLKIIN